MAAAKVSTPHLDARLGKFSQAGTFILTGLAFVLSNPWIVLIAAVILALSTIVPVIGPYRLVYRYILVPLHILRPRIVEDDPTPHRFAQGVGTLFLAASWLVLFLSHATTGGWTPAVILGWTLDLIVLVLSGLNLFVGFCMGCFVYYYLGRLGIMPRVRYEGDFHWRGV
jgi:hypothetical protein